MRAAFRAGTTDFNMRDNMHQTIGFTGTRKGMTKAQGEAVMDFLAELQRRMVGDPDLAGCDLNGLHGDCVGADADFDKACGILGIQTFSRPGHIPTLRAYSNATPIADAEDCMARNQKIVDNCNVLIACPETEAEMRKSGTWATIRMGRRKSDLMVIVIRPDGSIVEETPGVLEPAVLN